MEALQRKSTCYAITNVVETFDNEMLVDEMYQIGENDQLAHEPLSEHWDED